MLVPPVLTLARPPVLTPDAQLQVPIERPSRLQIAKPCVPSAQLQVSVALGEHAIIDGSGLLVLGDSSAHPATATATTLQTAEILRI